MAGSWESLRMEDIAWSDVTDVEAGYDRIAELIGERRGEGASLVTVLVPTVEASSVYKEEIAERGRGFGTRIEAFDVWLADMWELHGDGRRFVDAASRGVLCALTLRSANSLRATPGTIGLMARLVRENLPLLTSDRADKADLSPNEREFIECAKNYQAQLMERGLIEPCEAALALADAVEDQAIVVSGFDFDQLTPVHKTVISATNANVVRNLRSKAPDRPRAAELEALLESLFREDLRGTVEPSGAVRVVLPAGLLAENRLIIETLADLFDEERDAEVLMVSSDPERTFYSIAEELADRGVTVALKTTKPISKTGVGRALIQAIDLIERAGFGGKRAGAEFLANDVVGAGYKKAFRADAHVRKDRLMGADDVLETILGYSPHMWAEALAALLEGSLVSAFGKMSAAVMHAPGLSEGCRREQEEALATMKRFAAAAERERAPLKIMADAMDGQQIEVAVEVLAGSGKSRVEVVSMEEAASRRALSYDVLMICQMTSEDRPVRDRTTSRHILMEKLGEPVVRDPLGKERRTYYDALATAKRAVIMERSRHNAQADPAYPSAMFEETVALYPGAAGSGSVEAKMLGVPDSLLPFTRRLDETRYVYAVTGAERQEMVFSEVMPATGVLEAGAGLVMPPKGDTGERCVSASAIEKYLECPYLWFVERRLGIDELDEGLSFKEKGSFVHAVLEAFHDRLAENGLSRVTAGNVGEASALMGTVFDEVLANEALKDPKSSRYAVSAQMERERAAAIRRELVSYVESEASLLPGFAPMANELSFGYTEPVFYAGMPIRGRIDRVDVSSDGRAVVIDYKTGTLDKKCHESLEDPLSASLPGKVQALIYAQIVRRVLGLKVVGFAYVNPLAKSAALVYDEGKLDKSAISVKSRYAVAVKDVEPEYDAAFHSFEELLDWAEAEIAERIAPMSRGWIEPCAASDDVCGFCPALLCERRV